MWPQDAKCSTTRAGGGKEGPKRRRKLGRADESDWFQSRFSPLGAPSLRLAPLVVGWAAFSSLEPAEQESRRGAAGERPAPP